jgi:very-short-patch-repair endonuclease
MSDAEWRRSRRSLTRVAARTYAPTGGLTPEDLHRLRARAVLGRLRHTVASHLTAAVLWELPVLEAHLEEVQVSPTARRRGRPKSASGYWMHSRAIPEHHCAECDGLPVTDPLLTVLDSARVLDPDWGVVVADAALHRGLFEAAELAAATTGVARYRGSARARRLPDVASPTAESPGETLLRLRLQRMGLEPVPQVVIGGYRVDFLIDGCLVVEFDGRGKFTVDGDPQLAHWKAKVRHDLLTDAGNEVLHVTWADLWHEPALAARVMRALGRAHTRRGSL